MAVAASAPTRALGIVGGVLVWCGTTIRIMARNKAGFIGFIIVAVMTIEAFIAPIFINFNTAADVNAIYQGPSLHHLLGTDSEGRDVFTQILVGGQDILEVGYLASAFGTFLAILLGILSAYAGGWLDTFLTWVADVFLTLPTFAIYAVIAGTVHLNSNVALAILIAVFSWAGLMRAIRSQVLSLRERDFIEAARALDLSLPHIIFKELAPNMAPYIAIHFVIGITAAMYAEVGLLLLGIVPLSGQNWGVMLNFAWTRGAIFYSGSLSYILSPMAVIVIFQLALIVWTRSLSEVFDPRLRRGA